MEVWHLMTDNQRGTAAAVLCDLTVGTHTLGNEELLPPMEEPNSPMEHSSAIYCADTIASWIKAGFCAGPFKEPPLPNFRVNPLFMIVKRGKPRAILNMSAPQGHSFNDALNPLAIPKLHMANPKAIADAIYDWGTDTYLSKMDMEKAFKLIPIHPSLHRLQGFKFMGRYFVETQLIFGGGSSPALYDRLHEIFSLVVCLRAEVSQKYTYRTLDDFVVATPNQQLNISITQTYLDLAKEISLPLAPLDDGDKAFATKQKGTVLGIVLDARNKRWCLPADKALHHMRAFAEVIRGDMTSTTQIEKVLGMTQSVSQMIPAVKCLTFEFLDSLKNSCKTGASPVTSALKEQVLQWLRIYQDASNWLPLCPPVKPAPLGCCYIGTLCNLDSKGLPEGFWICSSKPSYLPWPSDFVHCTKTASGVRVIHLDHFLEAISILVAIVTNAKLIRGRHFQLFMESSDLVKAFSKGRMNSCRHVSAVIKATYSVLIHLNSLPDMRSGVLHHSSHPTQVEWPTGILQWMNHVRPRADLGSKAISSIIS